MDSKTVKELFSQNSYPGFFCVFEGVDYGGKDTQLERWGKYNAAYGLNFEFTRDPDIGPLGPHIRAILNTKTAFEKLSPHQHQQIFWENRILFWKDEILPRLVAGKTILQSRWSLSGLYSAFELKEVDEYIVLQAELFAKRKTQFIAPDLTLIYLIPPEISYERMHKSKRTPDQYENPETFARINKNYKYFCNTYSDVYNIKIIDGTKTEEQVFLESKQLIFGEIATKNKGNKEVTP